MPPTQPASTLVFDSWMDQDQYTSVQDLHSKFQSSSYDVALGAGYITYGLWTANNAPSSTAGVNCSFQYGEFSTFTRVNEQFNPNVYEPSQELFDLPLSYALPETDLLQEADLLAPSAGPDQSGDAFFPTHNVYNPSSTPLLSQSTSVGIAIDATAGVPTTLPRPLFTSERSNESTPNLHGPIQSFEPNTCQECIQSFPSNAELERHAKSLHHAAFECACGKIFAHLDNLKRHWNQTPRFPCSHCSRYTGADAFIREDHPTQHLRTWHRINNSGDNENDANSKYGTQFFCTWPNCSQPQRSFGIKSQHTNHMRRIHNYAPFPCPVQGCVKVGGKGYFRESDLVKHSKEVHFVED